jgi:uncharacterized protein (DUF1499 family)
MALLGAALLGVSGPGHRLGLWPYGAGLAMVLLAGAAGLVALSAAGRTMATASVAGSAPWPAAAAAQLALIVLVLPASWVARAVTTPVVNDVTTDAADPPPLDRSVPPSADASLAPLVVEVDSPRARAMAAQTAAALGWQASTTRPADGLLHFTHTTTWFGFVDDITVRVRPLTANTARVDVRSASRVGRSDLGTNARRIRGFLRALAAAARGAVSGEP